MGFLSVPNLVSWLIFRALIVTDQFCWITWHTYTWQGGDKRKRRWREEWAGGDYSREAIVLNISVRAGRLFKGDDCFKYFRQSGAIIQGRRLIEGLLLFEEKRYVQSRLTQLISRITEKPFATPAHPEHMVNSYYDLVILFNLPHSSL